MPNPFTVVRDTLKAWWRRDRRIAPHGHTGRVYARKDQAQATDEHRADARAHAMLEMKITRADGTVEIIRAPATVAKAARKLARR